MVIPHYFYCYRGVTVDFLPSPRYYREIFPIYRGITAFPITVSLSTETDLVKQKTDGRAYTYFFRYNHHLCQCTVYSKLGSFFLNACKVKQFWLSRPWLILKPSSASRKQPNMSPWDMIAYSHCIQQSYICIPAAAELLQSPDDSVFCYNLSYCAASDLQYIVSGKVSNSIV